jgi:hypothetical protein
MGGRDRAPERVVPSRPLGQPIRGPILERVARTEENDDDEESLVLGVLAVALAAPTTAPATTPPSPGANDGSCRPTAAHPHPVVLVTERRSMLDNWLTLSPALRAEGYCVLALNYGASGGEAAGIYATGPVAESARELAAFVDRVRAETGAPKVSLLGHSQGGMMPRQYIKFEGGLDEVDDLVGLAPVQPRHHPSPRGTAGARVPGVRGPAYRLAVAPELNAGDETPGGRLVHPGGDEDRRGGHPLHLGLPRSGAAHDERQDPRRLPARHVALLHDHVAIQWAEHALGGRGRPTWPSGPAA